MTAPKLKEPKELFSLYEETLQMLVDSMLPMQRVQTRFQPNASWFGDAYRQLRRNARRLERKYRTTHEPDDRNEWTRYL